MAKKLNAKKAGAKKGPFRDGGNKRGVGAMRTQLKQLAGVKNLGRGEG